MDLMKLGYTEKWMQYGLLNEELLKAQAKEFDKGGDKNTAHYRLSSFQNWLSSKKSLSNEEIEHYMDLAKEDPDELMAGTALRELFTSSVISDDQFEMIRTRLPKFGEWTRKLIVREVLKKRLKNEKLTKELFNECFEYKKEFKDNRLMIIIIAQTDNTELLSEFATNGSGKQLRTLALKKLNKIKKAANNG